MKVRIPHSAFRIPHSGFTLVEMLVAMVLTLIIVTSIAQFYAIVGESVKDGRAMIEMGGQMRAAVQRLKADLDLITVNVAPWTDEGAASGYFEYLEGVANDYNANGNFNGVLPIIDATEDADTNTQFDLNELGVTNMVGDGDDFIGFTIRTKDQPFNGRQTNITLGTTQIITSQLAEVVWWVGFDDLNANGRWDFEEPRQIYRRQLLIRPDITGIGGTNLTYADAFQFLRTLLQQNDISLSVRFNAINGSYFVASNSIDDLSKRQNRFAHIPANYTAALADTFFPHPQLLLPTRSAKTTGVSSQNSFALQGDATGEDIVLSNVLAFDVQAYDPYARIWPDSAGTTALVPNDPGYSVAAEVGTAATLLGLGAYVDLNYHNYLTANARAKDALLAASGISLPYFAFPFAPDATTALSIIPTTNAPSPPFFPAGLTYRAAYLRTLGSTYDTWSLSYERDGINQFNDSDSTGAAIMDKQTNGLDDTVPNPTAWSTTLVGPFNGVDDVGERETVPPYSFPLRGLQVKIRLYEPGTRQVRQATVATDFLIE